MLDRRNHDDQMIDHRTMIPEHQIVAVINSSLVGKSFFICLILELLDKYFNPFLFNFGSNHLQTRVSSFMVNISANILVFSVKDLLYLKLL